MNEEKQQVIYRFENYSKIEDLIYYIGPNVALKMIVNLYHNSEKIGRTSFYQEVRYHNTKVDDDVINIKRSFDYYASIENLVAKNGIKEKIMIRQQDIFAFRKVLNYVYDFFDKDFDKIFSKKDGKIIAKKIKPIEFGGLALGKYFVFRPDVTEYANSELVPCIRMNLSDPTNVVYMPQSKFAGLVECFNNMDMFSYAQNMITYLGKPEAGTNMYDMTDKTASEGISGGISGRKIGDKSIRKKSYFNK